MSLIWPASENDITTDQPRLHAFVIGVGDYPHLLGGNGAPANDQLSLSQVTTPRHTAPAIVDWLLNAYSNANCPLGSVEVLTSPVSTIQTNQGNPAADQATMQGIKDAFKAWYGRCNSHKDNIAFFYFCGHGIRKADQFLLPEDFGNPAEPNEWENCINFDEMRSGMRKCKADTQLFFVDACRETPFGLLTQLNVHGNALITASTSDSVACSATYYATTEGKKAFGPPNDVTYFGQAVLSCLKGAGGLNISGQWMVDTYQLSTALGQVVRLIGVQNKLQLACNPNVQGMKAFHEIQVPRSYIALGCAVPAANQVANIEVSGNTRTLTSDSGEPKPFISEVEAGTWDVSVTFDGGQYPAKVLNNQRFDPPVFRGETLL